MAAAVPAALERAYGVTNIRSHIPITLDLDEHNYDAWRELFMTHCLSFDVLGHLDGTLLPTDDTDLAWKKRDGIVKLWLYGTLSPNLFRGAFKTDSSSRDIWLRIENQFRNNKETRAIQLDNELRTKEIRELKVSEYCQEMKILADSLANVDAPVADRTLVMYLLNGLNAKFDNIINVIKHRQPFPTFDDARSMLIDEENRLKRGIKPSPQQTDHSSTSTVLTTAEVAPSSIPSSSQQHQNYGNRGRGRNNRGRGRGRNNSQPRQPSPQWNAPQWPSPYPMWPPPQFPPYQPYPQWSYPPPSQSLLGSRPPLNNTTPTWSASAGRGAPYQHTDAAQAFSAMTLQDPVDSQWYMDSGATSHLTASTSGSSHQADSTPQ